MGSNKVFWARHGQQIVARVKNSLKSRRLRSFEGYHDQLGADDVIPEEARNTSERACFGKVVLNERHVIIAGPNKQARLRAGKDALHLLQKYSTDEDLAAYIDCGEETAHRHCLSSQSANANAWGSQCWPGAASASSSLGQPVPGQPVPEEEPLKQNLASRSPILASLKPSKATVAACLLAVSLL